MTEVRPDHAESRVLICGRPFKTDSALLAITRHKRHCLNYRRLIAKSVARAYFERHQMTSARHPACYSSHSSSSKQQPRPARSRMMSLETTVLGTTTCSKGHIHPPWNTTGVLKVAKCESVCGFCQKETKTAANLRKVCLLSRWCIGVSADRDSMSRYTSRTRA